MHQHNAESAPAQILVVSSDLSRAQSLIAILRRRHFAVASVAFGDAERAIAEHSACATLLLDLADRAQEGLSMCRTLRLTGLRTPILIVHPQGTLQDLLYAFEVGANAYLSGPVDDRELLGHIGALCRRHAMDDHARALGVG
jgi:DNA-binding response OmpR family regulator